MPFTVSCFLKSHIGNTITMYFINSVNVYWKLVCRYFIWECFPLAWCLMTWWIVMGISLCESLREKDLLNRRILEMKLFFDAHLWHTEAVIVGRRLVVGAFIILRLHICLLEIIFILQMQKLKVREV